MRTKALLLLGVMVVAALLVAAACGGGGPSDAEKTATAAVPTATAQAQATATAEAQARATATAQAQATATAEAQARATATAQAQATATAEAQARATATAQATATALEALISQSQGAAFYASAYDGLSAAVKSRLEAASIDKAAFVEALSAIGPESPVTEEELQAVARVFRAIGDLEVAFLPVQFLGGLLSFPVSILQAGGLDIDEATREAVLAGTAFLTGSQVALVLDIASQFVGLEEGEEIPEPSPEELIAFFAALPAGVKGELEAAGWTEERIGALIASEADPSIEELRSLLGPLANIPIPPLMPLMSGFLSQFPPFLLEPLVQQLGQQAIDDLKAGTRAPTGREFLAFFEMVSTLEEDLGGEGEDQGPPSPEELLQILQQIPPQIEGCLRESWGDAAFDEIKSGARYPNITELNALKGCFEGGG